ncbi:MAG: outer membrane protein assembly factor BamD [Nitrospinota bacterium]|nr:MAG: outer membrane protein assembly factor BamD [Nitrospinota bacterium]
MYRPCCLWFLLGLAPLFLLMAAQTRAGQDDPQRLLGFADSLLQEGEYFRAITEYKRFLFSYPSHPRALEARYKIGLAYFRGQEWEEAILRFREIVEAYPQEEIARDALFMIGEAYYRKGDYPSAIRVYQAITAHYPQTETATKARYRIGWSLLRLRQWEEAATQFAAIEEQSPYYPSAQTLMQEAKKGETLPRKSPLLAGILSGLLPGAGQAYNGRYRDALVAFLLNGAFILGGIEAIRAGNEALAGAIFFFEGGWYSGNVYGAINAAHKFNRDVEERFLQGLELQHHSILRKLGSREIPLLHLSWRF